MEWNTIYGIVDLDSFLTSHNSHIPMKDFPVLSMDEINSE